MGFLTEVLRVLHPVRTAKRSVKRAVIPKPVRSVQHAVHTVTNPVGSLEGAAKYAAIGAVDRAITPKPKKRQRKAKGEATPAVAIHPATQASKDELVAFLNEHLSDEVSRQLKPMPWESKADDVAGAAYAAAFPSPGLRSQDEGSRIPRTSINGPATWLRRRRISSGSPSCRPSLLPIP